VPQTSRNRRRSPRRKRDALSQLELRTVKEDLNGCAHQVEHLERTIKTLRTEIDRLREKMGH